MKPPLRLGAAVYAALCLAGIGACISWFYAVQAGLRLPTFTIITALVFANLSALVVIRPRHEWSAAVVYLAVFSLFHFGLVGVYGLGLVDQDDLTSYIARWLFRPQAEEAAILAFSGTLAIGLGATVADLLPSERHITGKNGTHDRWRIGPAASSIGAVLVVASVGLWLVTTWRSGGLALLFASYNAYLEATAPQATLISLIWFVLGFGTVLVFSAPPSRAQRIGIAAFAAFCAIALPIGLRGEVMFPLAAGLVARAGVGRAPARRHSAMLIAAGLLVVVVAKQVRQVGLAEIGALEHDAGPLDAFVELGGSLEPVEKVVTWRDYGDPLDLGATYWAPIDRALYYVVPGWTRLPADSDPRIMNVLTPARVGPIGFSPVAEAYRNFGEWGVPIVMLLFGLILGSLDRAMGAEGGRLLTAVVVVALLINVRNSFVPVPAQLFLGLCLAIGVLVFSRLPVPRHRPDLVA